MYHIIINPASRSGKGKHIWEETIKPALTEKNVSYRAYFSEKPGDVIKLASWITSTFNKEAIKKEEFCYLLVLGGDGTVNEVLQGIVSPSRVIIGYIPTGSSNDLARDMKIPKNPLEALERILSVTSDTDERIRSMDRGIASTGQGERSFAVSCGLGFDAAVCEEAMHSKIKDTLNRLRLGKLTYLGIAVKQLFAAKRVSCELYLDDREPVHIKKIYFIATMNHRFEGGGFKFCPDADYADGLFDLCVAGNLPKLLVLLCLPTAFFGKHFLIPGINHYRAKRVRIHASSPLWLHTDGEVHEKTDELCLTCKQCDIRFIT